MFTKILTSSLLFLIAIGGFFVNIEKSEQSSIYLSYGISESYAADPIAKETAAESQSKWLNDAIQAFNAVLGVLTVIVSPAIIFAGWLLSPDWSSGDLFGLRTPMHDMWVIVSNIVYFIYAILLILIALATIFGRESFNYKSMLPKLALGILMVPFTWWFVQWTISLATVVTASVINIPMDMIKEDNPYINGNYIPTVYVTTTTTDSKGASKTADLTEVKCVGGNSSPDKCTSIQKVLQEGGGIYSPLLIYAYQVFRIQDYKSIDGTLNKIKTGGQLLNTILIGAIMFLIFGLLVMALIAMLLLRAIKLWMYAIFSPIFTLHFVAGKELFGKSTEGFDIKEFIGLCFVPAVVGLTLSFGLMIVSVIQSPNTDAVKCESIIITDLEAGAGGCQLISIMGNPNNRIIRGIYTEGTTKWSAVVVKIAGLTYIYKGTATNADDLQMSSENIKGGLSAAGGIFGTIIVDIIALIFIWMAFMAAKGVSKAVEAAVKPFEDMGNSVGKMAMSAPKYMPIPGLGVSAGGVEHLVGQAQQKISGASIQRANESNIGKFFGANNNATGKSVALTNDFAKSVKESGNAVTDLVNKFNLAKGSLSTDMTNKLDVKIQVADMANALKKMDDTDRKDFATRTYIDKEQLRRLIDKTGDKVITKDDYSITEFQELLVGKASGKTEAPTSAPTNAGFPSKQAADKDSNLIIDIGGVKIDISKTGDGIDNTELEKLKSKVGTWTREEFENNLMAGGISTAETRKKIIEAVSNIKDGDKEFFKPKEEPNKPA